MMRFKSRCDFDNFILHIANDKSEYPTNITVMNLSNNL